MGNFKPGRGLVFTPFILYSLITFIIVNTVIKPHDGNYKPYLYTVMMSYGILIFLFPIHYFSYKLFKSEKIKRSIDDSIKETRTYGKKFRTQWVLLVFLTPIILPIILYLIRLSDNISN